jgi:UDP-N-acetylmuramate--alanine ligase
VTYGIDIFIGQWAANIKNDIDVVVYTAAIREDNEEFVAVGQRGIPMLNRAELIGQLMLNFEDSIAVSGPHGKTTTTSMLSLIFLEGGLDPTISVGGILDAIGGNIRMGKSEHFIAEACEYTNTFLKFFPKRSIILNIDADHLDFFKDIDDIRNSFHQFAKLLPKDGQLFINGEISHYEEITRDLDCEVFTYGVIDPAYRKTDLSYDFSADHIQFDDLSIGSYDLYYRGQFVDHIRNPGGEFVTLIPTNEASPVNTAPPSPAKLLLTTRATPCSARRESSRGGATDRLGRSGARFMVGEFVEGGIGVEARVAETLLFVRGG